MCIDRTVRQGLGVLHAPEHRADYPPALVDGGQEANRRGGRPLHEPDDPDEQVACFRHVAEHLEPGGCFVIEVGVPDLQRLPPGETMRAFTVTPERLGFDEYDVLAQGLVSHHYSIVDRRVEVNAVPFRYVWPSELDLMARLAGMTLRERWSGWKREPFTSESIKHVSVWEKTIPPSRG